MTVEQHLKEATGGFVIQLCSLQAIIDAKDAEIAELRAKLPAETLDPKKGKSA